MFTDAETKLVSKLLDDHIAAIEPKLKSASADKNTTQLLAGQLKAAIGLRNKLSSSAPPKPLSSAKNRTQKVCFTDAVLVVDDDLLSRELNVSLLEEIGFTNIISALDGYRAITVLKENTADEKQIKLIICDWNMPNMSGLELLGIIRKDPNLAEMPFYLVTANHDKAHIMTALKANVSGYLVKPVAYAQLKEKLKPHYENDA
jgi:two-component system chemotaxis response regulator CheY